MKINKIYQRSIGIFLWLFILYFTWIISVFAGDTVCNETWPNYGLKVKGNTNHSWKKYNKIIYLDDKEDIACIYKALHDKENFKKGVAFVLRGDLDLRNISTWDYKRLNKWLNLSDYNSTWDTFLPIGGRWGKDYLGSWSAWWLSWFHANFYGNNHTIKVWDINYPNDDIWFFGVIKRWRIYDLNLIINNISWWIWNVWWFVWFNQDWYVENSSLVVNTVNWDSGVWWFVW